jgi:hypothetical protein
LSAILFTSCIKENAPVFEQNVVEIDAAAYNGTFGLLPFPIILQVPSAPGRPIAGSDVICKQNIGTVDLRVNLIGKQRSTPTVINYTTFNPTTVAGFPASGNISYGTTPVPAANAVSGTHYTTSGTLTIPANSSFGNIRLVVINTMSLVNQTRLVGLELTGGDVAPSVNYRRIVMAIDQR